MITPNQMFWALVAAVVIVALAAGAWYLFAPSDQVALPQENKTPGTITGAVMYPSDGVPAMHVCAQSVADASYERCTDTPDSGADGAPTYAIKVAPGTYEVYAFLRDPAELGLDEVYRAYYTEFVTCGLQASCTSHARIPVTVAPAQTVSDINPTDWYE